MRDWINLSCLGRVMCLFSALIVSRVCGQATLVDRTFEVGPGADRMVYDMVVQEDGRIVVGGEFDELAGEPCPHLGRLTDDGHLDPSFDRGTDATVYRLLEQPDGRILVAGEFDHLQGVARTNLGRLLTNGIVDPTFDAGGLFVTNLAPFVLANQPDGKVLVGTLAGSAGARLFRLLPDGELDPSFIQTNLFEYYHPFALHALTDGSILVGGGFRSVNGFPTPGLALVGSNGGLNTNFISGLQYPSTVSSFLEYTGGGFLVGGSMTPAGTSNRVLLRQLTSDLDWDAGFLPDTFENPCENVCTFIRSMALQTDGKILVGGRFGDVGGYWRRNVARLDPDGHVDPCFDPGLGLGELDLAGGVNVMRLVADGRVLVGGRFLTLEAPEQKNITRLLPDSECGISRVYLIPEGGSAYLVAATFPPGGVNYLQSSTNLTDWLTIASDTAPYLLNRLQYQDTPSSQLFFRGLKAE